MPLATMPPSNYDKMIVWSNGHKMNASYSWIPKCLNYGSSTKDFKSKNIKIKISSQGIFEVLENKDCFKQLDPNIPILGKMCLISNQPSDSGRRIKTQFGVDFGVNIIVLCNSNTLLSYISGSSLPKTKRYQN